MFVADDLVEVDGVVLRRRFLTTRRKMISGTVSAVLVVINGKLGDEIIQVTFAESNEMVQAFVLDRLHEWLGSLTGGGGRARF